MKTSPSDLLAKIAAIQQMEPGKLCQMQRGPNTAYYNLQCREHGKTRTQYVPADQVDEVKAHTENYQTFRGLVQEYADQIVDRTRAERLAGVKKRTGLGTPPRPGRRDRATDRPIWATGPERGGR